VSVIAWPAITTALAQRPATRIARAGRRAAVALVLREAAVGLDLLFIRRADDPRDPWSGQIAFPGGRSEPRDRDLEATAVRETLEETCLDLGLHGKRLGPLDEVQAMARMQRLDLAISPFVFRLTGPGEASAGHEVGSVHWIGLDALLDEGARSTTEHEQNGAAVPFPCLRLGDVVIWGLTYRILTDLTERLRPPSPGGTAG
jgi:8-oxo-dGTP pyrophosphatase MutT (NUDIX family)